MPKAITIVESNDIQNYPPVISLTQNLLENGHEVHLVGRSSSAIQPKACYADRFHPYELRHYSGATAGKSVIARIGNRRALNEQIRSLTAEAMSHSDILWTTSVNALRALGSSVLRYKHVMQLMELQRFCYQYKGHFKFPIDEYARKAFRVVVPEINRAYITQIWWNLANRPYVLPNKPYSCELIEPLEEMLPHLEQMACDGRISMLYLGGIFPDRDLSQFAEVAERHSDKYSFYIVGKPCNDRMRRYLNELLVQYPSTTYCGYYPPPYHLNFIRFAKIGLLPYKPVIADALSELNALYCAPNKIFEYAAFGVPMIGSDVIGLQLPFQRFGIGKCTDLKADNIEQVLSDIAPNRKQMAEACKVYYECVDLDHIVADIIYGDNGGGYLLAILSRGNDFRPPADRCFGVAA